MPSCAAIDYKSSLANASKKGISFHLFRKNIDLWIDFYKRKDYFNPPTVLMCSMYFVVDDFFTEPKS